MVILSEWLEFRNVRKTLSSPLFASVLSPKVKSLVLVVYAVGPCQALLREIIDVSRILSLSIRISRKERKKIEAGKHTLWLCLVDWTPSPVTVSPMGRCTKECDYGLHVRVWPGWDRLSVAHS